MTTPLAIPDCLFAPNPCNLARLFESPISVSLVTSPEW